MNIINNYFYLKYNNKNNILKFHSIKIEITKLIYKHYKFIQFFSLVFN